MFRGGVLWRFSWDSWDAMLFGGEGKAASSAWGVSGTWSMESKLSSGRSSTGENSKSGI